MRTRHDLSNTSPNDYQTAFEFWETIISNAVLTVLRVRTIERDRPRLCHAVNGLDVWDVDRKPVKRPNVRL